MAIVVNPITLPASKALTSMTTLITEQRFTDTLTPSNLVSDLVESCRYGKVEYGKGIVNTVKLDTQPVSSLSKTSSAFTVVEPNVAQETIEIDSYNYSPISISEILSKDALISGYAVDTFVNFVMKLLEDTEVFQMFDVANNLYQTWVPGQATQTITINLIDVSNLTSPSEIAAAEKWNANQIAKTMRKTINNMKIKNAKFTDVATYTDINTGSTVTVKSAVTGDDMKTVFNDAFMTDIMADSLASVYHEDKIWDMVPKGKLVLLAEDAMSGGNSDVIAWVSHKDKFAIADFYKVALGILDPSTLYRNTFLHFAYGAGVFKYLPGVVFKAAYTL